METMYPASINSPSTEVLQAIEDNTTIFSVRDIAVIPDAPNTLTLGYDTETPETVLLLSKNGSELTVQRGFDGDASTWPMYTSISRVFTAYDYEAFKANIEELQSGGGDFLFSNKFTDNNYIYFVGDIATGWRVNRYDIDNIKATVDGIVNKPTNLAECQALSYI
jgi:hypothetical protein